MRKRGKTQMHCCVSTATMVTRTRHNVTFIYIASLVLTEVRKRLSLELKDDSQSCECGQITDFKIYIMQFRAHLYNSCYFNPTGVASIEMLYYN